MEQILRRVQACCWHYTENSRNYPGLHFTATKTSCDSLLRFLDWLKNQPPGTFRTIRLRKLSREEEAGVSGGQAFECFDKLRLTITAEVERFSLLPDGDQVRTLELQMPLPLLVRFKQGLQDVADGVGDYCIKAAQPAPRTGEVEVNLDRLWFWPHFVLRQRGRN